MKKEKRPLPENGEKKVLLHSCCAPCCASIIRRMISAGLEPTVLFYNPNIYPHEEYERRKAEVIRYTIRLGVPFADADYDNARWFSAIKGYENAPERGERCSRCFEMRLGKTASYASQNGFNVFTTSLGISRWKDFDQVARAGVKAARLFPRVTFWDMNWRKENGTEMMSLITKEEKFYRQDYCGCLYSLERCRAQHPSSG